MGITSQISRADSLRESLVGRLPAPQPVEVSTVEVDMDFSETMRDYVDELYIQFAQSVHPLPMRFTKAELESYLRFILLSRVARVRGEKSKLHPADGHAVPAMFSVILEMIGMCIDETTGIILKPRLSKDFATTVTENGNTFDVNSKEDADRFSSMLRFFNSKGFVFAKGIPNNREGDFDFMSFAIIEDSVRHMKATAPEAYAVAAAMLSLTGLTSLFGKAVYTVSHGSVRAYTTHARDLAQPRNV